MIVPEAMRFDVFIAPAGAEPPDRDEWQHVGTASVPVQVDRDAPAEREPLNRQQRAILEALDEVAPDGLTSTALASALGSSYAVAWNACKRLMHDGLARASWERGTRLFHARRDDEAMRQRAARGMHEQLGPVDVRVDLSSDTVAALAALAEPED